MDEKNRRPGRSSSRDRLLDCAADIVSKHGVQQLTIEAVAAAAGVTKAGLIYHFKTRDDLLNALLERMIGELDVQARFAGTLTAEGSPKAVLQHVVQDTFGMQPHERQLMSNMLGAVASNPQLIGPVQALFARTYDWISRSGDQAGQAMLLTAALDGITLIESLNLHRFTPQQRAAMRVAIDNAIHELG